MILLYNMDLKHYENPENEMKEDVINFIYEYNDEFKEFDYSIIEQCNEWLLDDDEDLSGKDAITKYYNELCDELIIIEDNNNIVACRFVEYDEDDTYMRDRVDNYEIGLNLTFALVHKEYRNRGLWSRMYQYVINNILPKYPDTDRLYLATSSKNKAMKEAVKSAGFKRVGIEKNERGEGIHTLIYCYKTSIRT